MARHIITNVVVEELGHEGGFWCRVCALPSGWVMDVVVRAGSRMHFQRRPWCDECGRRDTVEWSK